MRTAGSIIYSKRYNEDEELFREIFGEFENEKKLPDGSTPEEETADRRIRQLEATPPGVNFVPDIDLIMKAKLFIAKARRFSEKHKVTAEICKLETMVSVRLYFTDEIISLGLKKALVELIDIADEVTGIPYPNGRDDWFNSAIVLNIRTHRSYIDGIEIGSR